MKILKTQEQFVKAIPTVEGLINDGDENAYSRLETYIDTAEMWLEDEVLGIELFSSLADKCSDEIKSLLEVIIACKAFVEAISFIDLILTSNGFGIVNNSNLSPASRERVEKLKAQCPLRMDSSIDLLLQKVYKDADLLALWQKAGCFPMLTDTLFWYGGELKKYSGKADSTRVQLMELRPQLLLMQTHTLAKYVSPEYLNELIDKRRKNGFTHEDNLIYNYMQTALGGLLSNQDRQAYSIIETAINAMVDNLEKYPAYRASQTYALKISEKYQNKKTDPTFFFSV